MTLTLAFTEIGDGFRLLIQEVLFFAWHNGRDHGYSVSRDMSIYMSDGAMLLEFGNDPR